MKIRLINIYLKDTTKTQKHQYQQELRSLWSLWTLTDYQAMNLVHQKKQHCYMHCIDIIMSTVLKTVFQKIIINKNQFAPKYWAEQISCCQKGFFFHVRSWDNEADN